MVIQLDPGVLAYANASYAAEASAAASKDPAAIRRMVQKIQELTHKHGKKILRHSAVLALVGAAVYAVDKALEYPRVARKLALTTGKLKSVAEVAALGFALYKMVQALLNAITPEDDGYTPSLHQRLMALDQRNEEMRRTVEDVQSKLQDKVANQGRDRGVENVTELDAARRRRRKEQEDEEGEEEENPDSEYDGPPLPGPLSKLQRKRQPEHAHAGVEMVTLSRSTSNKPLDIPGSTSYFPDSVEGTQRAQARGYGFQAEGVTVEQRARVNAPIVSEQRPSKAAKSRDKRQSLTAPMQLTALTILRDRFPNAVTTHELYPSVQPQQLEQDVKFLRKIETLDAGRRDAYARRLAQNPDKAQAFVDRVFSIVRRLKRDAVGAKVHRLGSFVVKWATIFAVQAIMFRMLVHVTKANAFAAIGGVTRFGLACLCALNSVLVLVHSAGPESEDTQTIQNIRKTAVRSKAVVHKLTAA